PAALAAWARLLKPGGELLLQTGDSAHFAPMDQYRPLGLPDHLIINSEYDNLQASGEAYAADLGRAGVSVEGYTELGAMHGHLNKIPAELPGCDNTINHMVRFMKNHLG
ncbi:MAG: hypothetical protein RL454_866, partial [Actinomycetota bacterium]